MQQQQSATDIERVKRLSLLHVDHDLFNPDYQNELVLRTWAPHINRLADMLYDKATAKMLIENILKLTKVETACRKVTDKDFDSMQDDAAKTYRVIMEQNPYLAPPRTGKRKEEWLYQNEFMIRLWAFEWSVKFPLEPNLIHEILTSDAKMHHIMKHVLPKARSIPRDRRHNQADGFKC